MTLTIKHFILGPLQNNSFLLVDEKTGQAVVVDPPYGAGAIKDYIREHHYHLEKILITHGHFDHIGGISELLSWPPESIQLLLHPDDQPLLQSGGNAADFGYLYQPPDLRPVSIQHGDLITVGGSRIEVRHTPGHSPGHVVYYLPEEKTVCAGDLIFFHGVGRTDLSGGSARILTQSIRQQILTLPPETILMPGHGEFTSVAEEIRENPFLQYR